VEELGAERLEQLRAQLLALREELGQLLEASADAARPVDLDQPIGRVSRIDAIQQQKMIQANRQNLEIRRRQTEAALQAMEEGEYGECRRCGEAIGYERLRARPESPLCVGCQRRLEASS
jgi:DnaK suppressor protein